MAARFVPVIAALVSLIPAQAGAQVRRPMQTDPAMAELMAYRLTTATLQKVSVVMQALSKVLETDPKYKSFAAAQAELRALQEKDAPTLAEERRIDALERQLEEMSREMEPGGAQTLDDVERNLGALPHMPEALAAAGLSAREYAKFTLVLTQTEFVADLQRTGQLRVLPPGVPMENLHFVIAHEKEIAALLAQMPGK